MRVRVLVADQSEARLFDLGPDHSLNLIGRLTDPKAHLHDRDLVSDRPGRKFDHAPLSGGRRGATAHHSTGSEHAPRRHEAEQFARRIAAELGQAHARGAFDALIVMSGPHFLGLLRAALPDAVRPALIAEVAKDLLHQGPESIAAHLRELRAAAARPGAAP